MKQIRANVCMNTVLYVALGLTVKTSVISKVVFTPLATNLNFNATSLTWCQSVQEHFLYRTVKLLTFSSWDFWDTWVYARWVPAPIDCNEKLHGTPTRNLSFRDAWQKMTTFGVSDVLEMFMWRVPIEFKTIYFTNKRFVNVAVYISHSYRLIS